MVHLSVGFGLVVAAAVTTTIGAFATDFDGVRSLLLVKRGFSTAGCVFLVYSPVSHE
jgi:hypothetical protein